MRIESVDFFYLSIPEVRDIGDGSQDACLARVRAGGFEGWGQCEASPLACIAAYVTPMSHSACKPVCDGVLGQKLDDPDDIRSINRLVRELSLDVLQADHTLSGIDIALWDLLGKKLDQPVWKLLGYRESFPKTPYASQLFGQTPEETRDKAIAACAKNYRATKFGWGPYGRNTVEEDDEQIAAAREGLGPDALMLIDAGTVWIDDVAAAEQRLGALKEHGALWLEEPFVSGAIDAYRELADLSAPVKLAGGEGAHNFHMARHLIDHGKIGFVQIDTGRIGGITTAKQVADYAAAKDVQFVNHTFTTQLSLSASLQPFAGLEKSDLCEYPVEPSEMAATLTNEKIEMDGDGFVRAPDRPGLGMTINLDVIEKYLVQTEISVGGKSIYRTPAV